MRENVQFLRDIDRLRRRVQALETLDIVPVVARYETNAGQSIPFNISTIINFEDLTIDTKSAVTIGAGWVFTAPVGGYYRVSARVQFGAQNSAINIDIYEGGVFYSRLSTIQNEFSTKGTDIIYLSRDDTINIRVLQLGASPATLTGAAGRTYVSINRISS